MLCSELASIAHRTGWQPRAFSCLLSFTLTSQKWHFDWCQPLQSLSFLFQPATSSNLPPEFQARRAPNGHTHTSQTARQRKENQVGPLLSGRGQTPRFQTRSVLFPPQPWRLLPLPKAGWLTHPSSGLVLLVCNPVPEI